jgi:hypothetical protein
VRGFDLVGVRRAGTVQVETAEWLTQVEQKVYPCQRGLTFAAQR